MNTCSDNKLDAKEFIELANKNGVEVDHLIDGLGCKEVGNEY